MPEIKTRDAVRGSIKALDKSAIVSKRMKDSLVKVKERSENSIRAKESSPEEYAGDKCILRRPAASDAELNGRDAVCQRPAGLRY